MLGKLMKYEWKATWKIVLLANLMIAVMTVLANITVKLELFDSNDTLEFVAVMVMMTYILSMFAVMIGVTIFLVYRFYVSTYSDQGYLLHTLPVDKHHIIISKVLVSAAWLIFTTFLMYLSVIILMTEHGELFEAMSDSVDSMVSLTVTGEVTGFAVVMSLIAALFSLFARILKVTACISLGQLSANHKLLLSFVYYFGIYIVQRIFSAFYFVFLSMVNRERDQFVWYGWESMLLSGIIYSVVFYLITWSIMDKKLNLE